MLSNLTEIEALPDLSKAAICHPYFELSGVPRQVSLLNQKISVGSKTIVLQFAETVEQSIQKWIARHSDGKPFSVSIISYAKDGSVSDTVEYDVSYLDHSVVGFDGSSIDVQIAEHIVVLTRNQKETS